MSTETDVDQRRAWWDLWVLLLPLLVAGIIGLIAAIDAGRDDTAVAATAEPVVEEVEEPADEAPATTTEAPAPATTAVPEPVTVVDIVAGDARLGLLTQLVIDAGLADTLSGDGPFTVFAPTDEALAAALAELGDAAEDPAVVEQILTYHVVSGSVDAATALAAGSAATVQGEELTFEAEAGRVLVNETIEVIDADLEADNGFVHVIDGVLVPPSLARPTFTVAELIADDPRLSALSATLGDLGLDTVLDGEGPFTVFAPTDDAFAAAVAALGSDAADPELIETLLLFHVVSGDLDSSAVAAASALDTVQGEAIDIDASGGSVVVDVDTEIVDPDLLAGNGVVHVVDQVLLPPSVRSTLALTASLNALVALEPIQFDTASAVIRPESQPTLDEAAEVLNAIATGDVEIQGHTDDQGADDANQALSEARADAVLDALVERGVDPDRLSAVGFGETEPVADNATPEGRQANRRIEFRLA